MADSLIALVQLLAIVALAETLAYMLLPTLSSFSSSQPDQLVRY